MCVREPRHELDRSARGYTFAHRNERRQAPPVLQHEAPELLALRVLTFLDMVELKAVALLRRLGISLSRIRAASEIASRDWSSTLTALRPCKWKNDP